MRLPPPPRRYSPISVIAVTSETVSRPNSRSMAARSSRRSSKTSVPFTAAPFIAGMLKVSLESWISIAPVIRKLHVNPKILLPQQRNNFLQRISILAADSHNIALDRCLHFFLGILDRLDDVAGLLDRDALLHSDLLSHRPCRC